MIHSQLLDDFRLLAWLRGSSVVRKNVPLAHQAILEILSGIDGGDIVGDGGLLPSEAELAQRFGVSRGTVREALAKLEYAGVVIRRHGIGTYVNHFVGDRAVSVQYWMDEAVGFMDLLRASNQPAERRVLGARVRAAGPQASLLGINGEAPVLSVERLYLAASLPLIHCMTVIPMHLVKQSKQATVTTDYQSAESPYQFLDRQCQRRVHHQRSEVRAVLADDRLAELLNWQIGQPLLRVEEVGYDSDLTPLFYGLNHFRADKVSFLQVRRPALSIRGQARGSTGAGQQ